jgi:hypothetical protein
MNKLRVITATVIFLSSLVLGFLAGAYATHFKPSIHITPRLTPTHPQPAVTMQAPHTPPMKASNGQRNILVTLIDHFSSKTPQIEGVWLVIDFPTTSHLTLLPVYPAGTLDGTVKNQSLTTHFGLDSSGLPSTEFLDDMAALDLWWDSYIVLDRMGLAELVDQISEADPAGDLLDGLREVAAIPSPADDPQAALHSQVVLFQALCKKMAGLTNLGQAADITNRLSRHYTSDLPPERIASGLHNLMSSSGSLSCEFPSLPKATVSQNHP